MHYAGIFQSKLYRFKSLFKLCRQGPLLAFFFVNTANTARQGRELFCFLFLLSSLFPNPSPFAQYVFLPVSFFSLRTLSCETHASSAAAACKQCLRGALGKIEGVCSGFGERDARRVFAFDALCKRAAQLQPGNAGAPVYRGDILLTRCPALLWAPDALLNSPFHAERVSAADDRD